MKLCIPLFLMISVVLCADDAVVSRMLDDKLNVAERNDACYALREDHSPEAVAGFARALVRPAVRACAARNLRAAGAVAELKTALAGSDPEIRMIAARELGALMRPELLDLLAQTARDPNLMVATNALQGLSCYQDAAVLPYLLSLAESGGIVAAQALSRAVQFGGPHVLAVSRRLLATKDVPLRLAALRAIGDLGDTSDIPALRELAAKGETAAPAGRGIGLVPSLDLSRAARNAIRQIESRS
jgi:HEAT repeat protein